MTVLQVKARSSGAKSGDQRAKLTILGVDSLAVFRVSLVFFGLIFAVSMVAWAVLWALFGISGYEARTNGLIDQLIGSTTYHLVGWQVFVVLVGFGAFFVLLASVLAFIAARLINLTLSAIGGLDVFVSRSRSQRGR